MTTKEMENLQQSKSERYSCDGCKEEPANIINVRCSVCDRFPGFNYCEHPADMWEE